MEPFKLADTENRNSKIELEFKTMGKCYAYGVEFTIGGIKEEWLFEINSRTDKEIFTRKVDTEGNKFTFGKVDGDEETKMLLKFLAHGTPADTSFLSDYVRRNGTGLDAIKVAKNWFADGLKIIFLRISLLWYRCSVRMVPLIAVGWYWYQTSATHAVKGCHADCAIRHPELA